MDADVNLGTIEPGMAVYGADGELLGPVEAVQAESIRVLNQTLPVAAITRVDTAGVHLLLARAAFAPAGDPTETPTPVVAATTTQGERIVVSLAEERLSIETREVDLGEVFIRKRVVEEERLVPVIYRREEVEIIRREAGQPWPAGADEAEPGVEITRIPLRGEEPVLAIRQVVSREVVVEKVRVAEERQITDTVRREHVAVEERYLQARPRLLEQFTAGRARATDNQTRERTFEQAEPQYRAGFSAANDPRYDGRDFEAVEADLRPTHDAADQSGGDGWARLREEIREGWEAARGR